MSTLDSVELIPYDPAWPKIAELEIKKLYEILPTNHILDMQHVGSTAIPGMLAKPVIDIQIAVDSLTAIKPIAIDRLKAYDYVYWADNPDPERLFFVKGMPPFGEKHIHHIHIYEPRSKHWQDKILFRDYLIAHPDIAHEYEQLKIALRQYTDDREQYTDAKKTFVHDILRKAKEIAHVAKQRPTIIFLTGASGAGKTTLLNHLHNKLPTSLVVYLHFDSIGVPSEKEMIATYGSGSEWQKAMTYHWVKKLINGYKDKELVILEGQVNLDFIAAAFKGFNFHQYRMVLVHCDNMIRHQRLHQDRQQSELINKNMDNWSAFLRKQATDRQVEILDSTRMDIDAMATWLKNYIYAEMGI